MNAEELLENYNIEHWRKYAPELKQYIEFGKENANIILAGYKIQDVYTQFSMARASLLYLEVEDYGQLISGNDDTHLTFIKSKFLFDALALYNYCIDLSWQVLYLYHGDAHFGVIQDDKYYLQSSSDCNLETLQGRLVKIAKKNVLFKHVNDFFNTSLTSELRESYNYIKHRGTFHIEGLGLNDTHIPIDMDGFKMKMLNRRSIKIDEFKEKLIQFDISFIKYFESIIESLIPEDYVGTSISFETLINTALNLSSWEKERQDK